MRMPSSSDESSTSSSSSSSYDDDQDQSEVEPVKDGPGRGKVWSEQPLSIMWCLTKFDAQNKDKVKKRVIVYKQKTVLAVEDESKLANNDNHPAIEVLEEEIAPQSTQRGRKRQKSKTRRRRRRHRGGYDPNYHHSDDCESSESIDSSPTSYKNDQKWTGFKIKRRNNDEYRTSDGSPADSSPDDAAVSKDQKT
jgi:hypothetical protein